MGVNQLILIPNPKSQVPSSVKSLIVRGTRRATSLNSNHPISIDSFVQAKAMGIELLPWLMTMLCDSRVTAYAK